jgi:hypothetical protein
VAPGGEVDTATRLVAAKLEQRFGQPFVVENRPGAGSTRAAAEAGVDWIVHADLATERDLEAVAKAGMPILPTATFL